MGVTDLHYQPLIKTLHAAGLLPAKPQNASGCRLLLTATGLAGPIGRCGVLGGRLFFGHIPLGTVHFPLLRHGGNVIAAGTCLAQCSVNQVGDGT